MCQILTHIIKHNKQLNTFNSRYYCPGTAHVNCFTTDWSTDNNYLCPPVSLIGSTLRQLRRCKGRGTLVIPHWESGYFWPLIQPNGHKFAEFVKRYLVLDPYFVNYGHATTFNGFAPFLTLALELQF